MSPKLQLEPATAEVSVPNPLKGATEGVFIVRLAAEPLATYRGGVANLQPTSPDVTGAPRLDVASEASRAYVDYLEASQATFVARMEKTLGHEADVRFTYQNSLNGVAVWLTPQEAARVARLPGVSSVRQEIIEQINTDVGPTFIGAPGLWGGATSCEEGGYCGEGVIVGVLDSGIAPNNSSFAATGGDGYVHTNPLGSYVGVCDAGDPDYDPTFTCNDKLIGARDYTSTDAFDDDGHGSHTASTAAGNFVSASAIAPTITVNHDISGVAPHANIISYRVCLDGVGCPSAGTIAAIEDAIADGVHVINFSVGSPSPEDPWSSDSQLAWLSAREAGISVAHSAGNEGPGAATVGSPQAPWMAHTAASTHTRKYVNSLTGMTGGDTTPPADIEGVGLTSGVGPLPIVYAGDFPSALTDTPELCGVGTLDDFVSPWDPGTFTGHIVVCDRGTFGRVEKGANVLAAGAAGYVLADNGAGIVGDAHELPGVHITQADGAVLKTWLDTGTGHTATIGGAVLDVSAANGDIMAGFSSRGPNRSVLNMISPSFSAPGVDILAAEGIGMETVWGFNSGTSMSSPHAAGAMALLKQAHPTWTPAEIQSALMTTAHTDMLKEDGVTPTDWFDMGSGRIQVDQATDAGLVLDIDNATFVPADPSTGGDPSTLNLASMANAQCVVECEFTRTVTATAAGTWTATATAAEIDLSVTPASFTLAEGETQDLTITAGVEGLPNNEWIFGDVTMSAAGVPDTLLPVAVAPSTGSLPASVEIATRRDAGSQLVENLTAIEITELTIGTYGLTIGTQMDLELAQDSDNGSAFDDVTDGVTWTTVDTPAGAWRLVAETFDSESPDLDLFVGTGDTPSESSLVCTSASASANEFCDISNPAEGTYWILVQNWSGSGADMDAFTLSYGVVSGDEGNLLIEGPAQQPQLDPFDVLIRFNEPAMEEGDRAYGLFTIGTSPAKPGNVGSVPINLVRQGNDVTKSVSPAVAEPGEVVTYSITVHPNPTDTDIAYEIVDHIPDGLTYVPGSATGGLTLRSDGALTWSGTMDKALEPFYTVTDSDTDPMCDTGFGGYLNLEDFAIMAQPGITGDTVTFSAFAGQNPFAFFGDSYTGLDFSDDGFAVFGSGYGGAPWVPQVIPNTDAPNNLLAGFWHDFELFYDAATNQGVSLAVNGPDVSVIEFDDLEPFGGGAPIMDMEIVLFSTQDDTPGFYEAVVAFDNVASTPTGTIGVENATGTGGSALLNNADSTGVISDGFQVCFDLTASVQDPVVLTYDVTVDLGTEGTTITNEVSHDVDTIGGMTETSSVDLPIGDVTPPVDGDMLTASDVLSSSLTLNWGAATDDRAVTGYGVYQNGMHIGDVMVNGMNGASLNAHHELSYDVTGLSPDTEYEFVVKAEDAQGNQSSGLSLTVTTSVDFTDDDFSIFEDDIEWLYSSGITRGCNPPLNDQFCPNDNLTRGQLAAMLTRALDLPATTTDYFTDDDGSVFEDDINRVAEAGITLGCNPPDNDNFCPDDNVTRGAMAAFMDRALDLPATTTDYFTDDDGHIFEDSINAIALAGITAGCNPPDNDNYCPNDLVTRGQIAAFFRRALG